MKRKGRLAAQPPPEIDIARARGNHVFDARGRRYIDFVAGWCVGNFGWGNPEIRRAVSAFRGPDYVYPGFGYKPWAELAALLASLAPRGLDTCFRATGGSEAVDLSLQAAMIHTGRRAFLSLEGSYHGNTIAALSVGASGNLLPHCDRIRPPLDRRALAEVERRLKKRDVAAFIMEPVGLSLGVLIPDRVFMTGLQRLCRRYGTLLIMDEVATGFGRTGRVFGSELYGLEPDLMPLGKAITGGVAGMGAVLATAAVGRSMEREGSFFSTFGWHPLSVAAAIATLKFVIRYRKRLISNVSGMSSWFSDRLLQVRFRRPAALRVQGLAIGIDVGDAAYAEQVEAECRRRGLLIGADGPMILLLPALNIDRAIAGKAMSILEKSV